MKSVYGSRIGNHSHGFGQMPHIWVLGPFRQEYWSPEFGVPHVGSSPVFACLRVGSL